MSDNRRTGRCSDWLAGCLVTCVLVSVGLPAPASPGPPPQLQLLAERIRDLEGRLDDASFEVDCAAGQTVTEALSLAREQRGPVTVTIRGVCVEQVAIDRSGIELRAGGPGDGLAAPGPGSQVLLLSRAHGVVLQDLTITGGSTGITTEGASAFEAFGLTVEGASDGIVIDTTSSGFLRDASILDNSGNGVVSSGNLTLDGGTLDGNHFAVRVEAGGSVDLVSTTISNSIDRGIWVNGGALKMAGVVLTGTQVDGVVANQAELHVSNSTIDGNAATGIILDFGAAAQIMSSSVSGNGGGGISSRASSVMIRDSTVDANLANGISGGIGSSVLLVSSRVRDNQGDGVHLADTSVLEASTDGVTPTEITGNTGTGLACDPAPAVAQVALFDDVIIQDNGTGDLDCPVANP